MESTSARLFTFPEHQVHKATNESHGEADPGQNVGGAVRALLKTGCMEALLLCCVDGGCDHHTQRGKELDDSSENETLSLVELEELKDEDKEADATQNGGEDHSCLDSLQICCIGCVTVLQRIAGSIAGVPQVNIKCITSSRGHHPPCIVDGCNKKQNGCSQMEEDDEG